MLFLTYYQYINKSFKSGLAESSNYRKRVIRVKGCEAVVLERPVNARRLREQSTTTVVETDWQSVYNDNHGHGGKGPLQRGGRYGKAVLKCDTKFWGEGKEIVLVLKNTFIEC